MLAGGVTLRQAGLRFTVPLGALPLHLRISSVRVGPAGLHISPPAGMSISLPVADRCRRCPEMSRLSRQNLAPLVNRVSGPAVTEMWHSTEASKGASPREGHVTKTSCARSTRSMRLRCCAMRCG